MVLTDRKVNTNTNTSKLQNFNTNTNIWEIRISIPTRPRQLDACNFRPHGSLVFFSALCLDKTFRHFSPQMTLSSQNVHKLNFAALFPRYAPCFLIKSIPCFRRKLNFAAQFPRYARFFCLLKCIPCFPTKLRPKKRLRLVVFYIQLCL